MGTVKHIKDMLILMPPMSLKPNTILFDSRGNSIQMKGISQTHTIKTDLTLSYSKVYIYQALNTLLCKHYSGNPISGTVKGKQIQVFQYR